MGIMDMFSGMLGNNAPAAAAPAPAAATVPGAIPATAAATGATDSGTAPNGTIPATTEATPLDQFSDIWKNEATGDAKPAGVFGEIDPKRFMEAAGKVDFSKSISADHLKAVAAGGEDAVKAFAAAMNAVAQNVYAQSSFASTKITEQAIAKAKESLMAELPQHIRNQSANESLRAENPIFSHPAASPILGAVQSQLAVKFPQATAAELTTMAKQYLEHFANGITSTNKKQEPETKSKETDWSTFLS